MPIIPCPNKIGCESDYPVTNYSSEDADPRTFIGVNTGTPPTSSFPRGPGGGGPRDGGPDRDDTGNGADGTAQTGTGGNPPPLGSTWDNPVITTFAESTVSQADAHDAAGNDNVSNMTVSTDTGEDTGGILLPGRIRPVPFGNDAQTCTITCPDGQPFSKTVAANTFRALSKKKANAAALSAACKQAQLELLCLSAINGSACVGSAFSQTVLAYSANIPITFTVIDGDIPSWMSATVNVDRVALTGTPTISDTGSTTFTIEAVDIFGNSMSRAYEIDVMGLSSNPPDGIAGTAYSHQLSPSGGDSPYTFSVFSGSLPVGVTMSTDGLIEGNPILSGTYDFVLRINDATGRVCLQQTSLDVAASSGCPAPLGSIAVSAVIAGLANVGARSGDSNLMFIGSFNSDTVTIVDTDTELIVGSFGSGLGIANGPVYVPEVLGSGNPSDCIYVVSPEGAICSVDIDTLVVTPQGSTGDTLTTFLEPVYATTPDRIFFGTVQGTSGVGNQPTATLWYFPILGGGIVGAYVNTSGAGEAQLALSHYVGTTNQVWFRTNDLGGLNSLSSINASTLAFGTTITLVDIISGQGTWCSLNNRFYVPVYPGGAIPGAGPWRLDVRTAGGVFIHSLSLPSFCRGVVIDTSRQLILALCHDAIRCFDIVDSFVCDISSDTVWGGAFCPESAVTYASLLATTSTIG